MTRSGASLFAAVTLCATLTGGGDPSALVERLRAAMREAGCAWPIVEMVKRGPDAPLEIAVSCRADGPTPAAAREGMEGWAP